MAKWQKAWWEAALEAGHTLVDRMVAAWAEGRQNEALRLGEALGVEEDVAAWPEVQDPSPYSPAPRVGRWEKCPMCEGTGVIIPRWAYGMAWADPPEPPENFAQDCPACGGLGGELDPDPIGAHYPEDPWGEAVMGRFSWEGKRLASWVARYREARQRGATPDEARVQAGHDGEMEDYPPDRPLPF